MVDSHIAFTGELSLKGDILPVGGIKEKIIAAKEILNFPKIIIIATTIMIYLTIFFISFANWKHFALQIKNYI